MLTVYLKTGEVVEVLIEELEDYLYENEHKIQLQKFKRRDSVQRKGVSLSSELLVIEPKTTLQLQSPEGRQIAELTSKLRHSLTVIRQYLEQIENTGETDYNPVPPKHSALVTMRAQFVGRGKPLPYPID
jgi:hypothetical protein